MQKRIYMDHAASTPVSQEVFDVMKPFLSQDYGNPSSIHQEGKIAHQAIQSARKSIAQFLNAQSQELIFTGSGTESCNLALTGAARARASQGRHIITTSVEHHAVLETCKSLEQEGFDITYLPVDEFGMVSPNDVASAIKADTILVSVIFGNNEVGSINPIKAITRAVKKKNPAILVHTDACQVTGYEKLDVKSLNVDLVTINGSKVYGPKGIGLLYVKAGTSLDALIHGGGQEQGLRSGTENVANIVGLAKALELVDETDNEELIKLRDEMIAVLKQEIPDAALNGHPQDRLANNINISIPGMDGETLVIFLDQKGIACSTGAACTTAKTEPSHVLLAMGKFEAEAKGSLRFTLGKATTAKDLKYTVEALKDSLKTLNK
jgi:cysteine desulfurase